MLVAVETGPSLEGSGLETAFVVAFAFVAVLVLLGFAFVIYAMVRSARAARRAGIDPFTSEAQLLAQAVSGRRTSIEKRLRELDDLHRRGIISDDEHKAARSQALAGP